MSDTTRWRYFLAYQDPRQEAWLEEQARRGLHLVRPGLFRFVFRNGEPREEKYRLDFQTLCGAARNEYLTIFRDAGWEFLGQVANRYYFRARADAFSPEIFSDTDSRKERIRRQMRFGAVILGGLVFAMSMGITQLVTRMAAAGSSTGPLVTIILGGGFGCLGAWCLWQMEQAYKREQ